MWDAINQPQFQSLLTPLLQKIFLMPYVPAAITWGTITIEISYPFLIWIPRLNVIVLTAIILLHIFIAVVFGLWLFASVMIVFNLAAFGHVFWERKISSN
jgi:hypothetical protein